LAILNPQFAFLEADLKNPNLNKVKYKEMNATVSTIEVKFEDAAREINVESKTSMNPAALYLKSYTILTYAYAVPVDIYSATLFLLVKNF